MGTIQGEFFMGNDLKNKADKVKPPFKYRVLDEIGRGNDRVYRGIREDTDDVIAVKKTLLRSENRSWSGLINHFEKCVDGYMKIVGLEHPNIIKHLGMELDREDRDNPYCVLLMEHCPGGNLYEKSCSKSRLSSASRIKHYARQIVNFLQYLFKNGVCHLDLKGANILLVGDELDTLKICDFGEVVKLESALLTSRREVPQGLGTVTHMAPEMMDPEDIYRRGRSADVYSFGCVLIEMLTGKLPEYKNANGTVLTTSERIFHCVMDGGGPEIPLTPQDLRQLIEQCLRRDPAERIKAAEIAESLCLECFALQPVVDVQFGMTNVAIGIDYGTINSCVAVFRKGKAEVIPSSKGHHTNITPSYVVFDGDQIIVGDESSDFAFTNPRNAIYGMKRIIGQKFQEPAVQECKKIWPFTIIERDGMPVIQVDKNNNPKYYTSLDISSFVLKYLRESAEYFLDTKVSKAVIAVPADFTDSQRKATQFAGENAGLEIIGMIDEPVAAAVHYNMNQLANGRKILIFAFGDRELDVSILEITNGPTREFHVLASKICMDQGGLEFTDKLQLHFTREIDKHNRGPASTFDPASHKEFLKQCNCVRERLTKLNYTTRIIHHFTHRGRICLPVEIGLVEFELLCKDLFDRILEPVKDVLQSAALSPSGIERVVMIGSCSHMLKVKEILSNFFPGITICQDMDAETAVASGAATYANFLLCQSYNEENLPREVLSCVPLNLTPHRLAVKIAGGHMQTVIPQGTITPASATQTYTTAWDSQTAVHIEVYMPDVHFGLTSRRILCLEDIAPDRARPPRITVSFLYHTSGALDVTARDARLGRSVTTQFDCSLDG